MNALRDALHIARFDLRGHLRERETLVWLFVMPIVFCWFLGSVTAGAGGGGERRTPLDLVAPADGGFLVDRVTRRLEENGYRVRTDRAAEDLAESSRVLTLPEGFTDKVLTGDGATVVLEREEAGLGQDLDSLAVGRAVYTTLADVIAAAEDGLDPTPETLAAVDEAPRPLSLRVESAGDREDIPTGFEQTIPGILVMFTLMAMLTGGATLHVIERRQGLLRRLASTPLSRRTVVGGKWLGQMGLGTVQIVWLLLAGTFLFGMDWGPDLPMILAVVFAWAAFTASLGLVLGSLGDERGAGDGISVLTTKRARRPRRLLVADRDHPALDAGPGDGPSHGWTMDAMHRLISFRHGAGSALPHLTILLVGAVLLAVLAARRFRFE